MKVAITGATGFVGSRLVKRLLSQNHQPLILTRNPTGAARMFPKLEIVAYTPTVSGSWQNAIAGCDAVVNLAGVPIAEHRWSPQRKEEIFNSRQLVTQKIVEAIAQANPKPAVLINTSAIGYYGTSETATFDENSPSGNDFLAQVCQAWEGEAMKVKDPGVRLVILRFGIVLGNGGALAKMLPPFQMFAGGPIGTGKQWFSWIHIDDLVNLIITALTQSQIEGVLNATAPNPVRMSEFCHTLGEVLHRPSWLPVPSFAIEALLGEGASVVLEGQEVLPKRTLNYGFQYQYPTAKEALTEILTKNAMDS
ncbi:MAG TPA: TIGR01777 family protein [Cyanobacteria bacterium UBA11149]|nr:TIGR01777 family protein [Cyanobacteria bacterium UBA11367]HBE56965.1 TIGR01777 family protein [Cyanobacteria bacterium UBA11366]HBK65192.1 TIGR01777 family protein [Cyanobacteria bacterium UBA11166]HBR74696.1 TIGR01777 family protein [Cyanobacteria bacterium UBA11159]HBS71794.1 TIGR01777 family protein [Cyanobacteria bacterium UBA11153]HBW91200.1 TIGR01777 family protein [Cyanobacteria bacterium UBA11149]HCA97553.1 TIGR01777 family protein [Cyanobacteria bacterium UBA9226]